MTKFVETVDYLLEKSPAGYKLAKILFDSNRRKIIRHFVGQSTVLDCETSVHLFYSESSIVNVILHCIILNGH